jgi:hypothetical protein
MTDFELFLEEFRNKILTAADEACEDFDVSLIEDSDLPELFKSVDALAKKLWERDE